MPSTSLPLALYFWNIFIYRAYALDFDEDEGLFMKDWLLFSNGFATFIIWV